MKKCIVNNNDITMSEDYCYLHQGAPFSGIGLTEIDGKRIKETSCFDGMKHGWEKIWDYDEDVLISETYHQRNSIHGIVQRRYLNGQRKSLEYFEFAIRIKGVTWNQFGEIVELFEIEESDSLYENWISSKASYYLEVQEIKDKYKPPEEDQERLNQLEKELDEMIKVKRET